MMGKSKKDSERAPVSRRAMERYGKAYSEKMRITIINQIQRGEASFLDKISNRLRVFAVNYDGETYPVVYDEKRKE